MLPTCFYRVSSKALITRDDKVLLLMEPDGRWELPGGGLEVGESFDVGLEREIKEELGVNVTNVSSQPVYTWTLVDDDRVRGVTPKLILVFNVKVDSYDFVNHPEESVKIEFFSKDEMLTLNLHPSIKPLPEVL